MEFALIYSRELNLTFVALVMGRFSVFSLCAMLNFYLVDIKIALKEVACILRNQYMYIKNFIII